MRYAGLVAGLGNPGAKYAGTRHNMGFIFVDDLLGMAARQGQVEEMKGAKFHARLWKIKTPELEGEWLVAEPQTFMNDSGIAIKPLLAWHELDADQLVVVQDELDLPAGAIRFKYGGGLAGHKGLLSITAQLGTRDYYRLRIGTGKPAHKEDVLAWVLGKPAPLEREAIARVMPYALETLFIFSKNGFAAAQQFAHAAEKEALR